MAVAISYGHFAAMEALIDPQDENLMLPRATGSRVDPLGAQISCVSCLHMAALHNSRMLRTRTPNPAPNLSLTVHEAALCKSRAAPFGFAQALPPQRALACER